MRAATKAIPLLLALLGCDSSNPVSPVGGAEPAPATSYSISLSASPSSAFAGVTPEVGITVTVVSNSGGEVAGMMSVSTSLGTLDTGASQGSLVTVSLGGSSVSIKLIPGDVPGMAEVLARIDDSAASLMVEVKDPGDPPEAAFEFEANGLEIIFTDLLTGGPTAWEWDFGDGATSMEQSPVHEYAEPGTYKAQLTVTNVADSVAASPEAFKSSVTRFVPVEELPDLPVADFLVADQDGLSVIFNYVQGEGGAPDSWFWDFGDGATSAVENPGHLYEAAGTYPVTLEVANAAGRSSVTKLVAVTGGGGSEGDLVARFSSARTQRTVIFTDESTGDPTMWEWDFGDGTAKSNAPSPVHGYAQNGTYPVTLTISNGTASTSISDFVCVDDLDPPDEMVCPTTTTTGN